MVAASSERAASVESPEQDLSSQFVEGFVKGIDLKDELEMSEYKRKELCGELQPEPYLVANPTASCSSHPGARCVAGNPKK